MTEEIVQTILQYLPIVLVFCETIILAFGQKSNLLNGLKTITDKANEINESAKFAEVRSEMMAIIEQQKTVIEDLKKLRNEINKIENREE